MRFMQTESVLQTKNRSGPAKNRFSVALVYTVCPGLSYRKRRTIKAIVIIVFHLIKKITWEYFYTEPKYAEIYALQVWYKSK